MCDTAVETTAGGLATGWWAAVWECFSSHPLAVRLNQTHAVSHTTCGLKVNPGFGGGRRTGRRRRRAPAGQMATNRHGVTVRDGYGLG